MITVGLFFIFSNYWNETILNSYFGLIFYGFVLFYAQFCLLNIRYVLWNIKLSYCYFFRKYWTKYIFDNISSYFGLIFYWFNLFYIYLLNFSFYIFYQKHSCFTEIKINWKKKNHIRIYNKSFELFAKINHFI